METPVDGEMRFDQLNIFLTKRGLKREVYVAEDATAVEDGVQVNTILDRLNGFSRPLLKETGLPDVNAFPASTFKDILEAMDNNDPAPYINVIMVKSTDEKDSASFCLCAYATDLKFDAENVLQRWNYIKLELERRNIKVLGFSSDGATNYLKTMKHIMNLPNVAENDLGNWFICTPNPVYNVMQDIVHIGTKLRTRFLNDNEKVGPMKMGLYTIDPIHVKDIIEFEPKSVHNLNMGNIKGKKKIR